MLGTAFSLSLVSVPGSDAVLTLAQVRLRARLAPPKGRGAGGKGGQPLGREGAPITLAAREASQGEGV